MYQHSIPSSYVVLWVVVLYLVSVVIVKMPMAPMRHGLTVLSVGPGG